MDEFDRYRADMNAKLLGGNHLGIKRFFALDTQAYEDGALDKRTKELLGLVASIVLRCDDCVTYHIKQSVDAGVTRPEFLDAFNIALVVGGSITIPHLRRAVDRLDQTFAGASGDAQPHAHE
ncbi:MAG TPA: carboxymuconolactone decarboxylase family protein [Pyrinomonadaceae bacterium]|jgi:AhpD family alkylhydroperoxidase